MKLKAQSGMEISAGCHAVLKDKSVLVTSCTEHEIDGNLTGRVQYAYLSQRNGPGFDVEMFDPQGNRIFIRVHTAECDPAGVMDCLSPGGQVAERTPGVV